MGRIAGTLALLAAIGALVATILLPRDIRALGNIGFSISGALFLWRAFLDGPTRSNVAFGLYMLVFGGSTTLIAWPKRPEWLATGTIILLLLTGVWNVYALELDRKSRLASALPEGTRPPVRHRIAKSLFFWLAAIALPIVLIQGLSFIRTEQGGIRFTIVNGDATPLDSLVVLTTGHRYPLGGLAPGADTSVVVRATGESHIDVEYGPSPARKRLVVGSYFEPGYEGTVIARVRNNAVRIMRNRIRPY